MLRTRALASTVAAFAALTTLAAGLSACSSKKPADTSNLPAGTDLVSAAATAMRQVQTAHIIITADGQLAGIPLRRADAVLTRTGDAQGSLQLDQLGVLVEFNFVIVDKTVYLKGPTGGWQHLPLTLASNIYDPSAILNPDRGVANILATANDAHTEARETVDGHDTYRVAVKLDPAAMANLVPGIGAGVTGKLWLDIDSHLLRKAVFQVPGPSGGQGGTVTISGTDYNAPVSVHAP